MTLETFNQPGQGLTVAPGSLPAAVTEDAQHSVAEVAAWLQRAGMYQQLARMLVRGVFVPDAFKPDIPRNASPDEVNVALATAEANAVGAMMFGESLGLDPIVSLQNLHVIKGKPGAYTKTKVALVQAAGHEVWDGEVTRERAEVFGRRKGWPEDRYVRIEITMQDAKDAGWCDQNAQYRKTPKDMLWSRAADRVCERIAGDLLRGIASVEDLQDGPEAEQPVAVTRVTAQDIIAPPAETAATSAAERPEPAPPTTAQPEQETGELISDAQIRRMQAQFRELGIAHRDKRLRVSSHLTGLTLASARDLTTHQAAHLIRVLDELLGKSDAERQAALEYMLGDQQPGQVEPAPPPASEQQIPVEEPTGGDRS